jgi:hypothetical protein
MLTEWIEVASEKSLVVTAPSTWAAAVAGMIGGLVG